MLYKLPVKYKFASFWHYSYTSACCLFSKQVELRETWCETNFRSLCKCVIQLCWLTSIWLFECSATLFTFLCQISAILTSLLWKSSGYSCTLWLYDGFFFKCVLFYAHIEVKDSIKNSVKDSINTHRKDSVFLQPPLLLICKITALLWGCRNLSVLWYFMQGFCRLFDTIWLLCAVTSSLPGLILLDTSAQTSVQRTLVAFIKPCWENTLKMSEFPSDMLCEYGKALCQLIESRQDNLKVSESIRVRVRSVSWAKVILLQGHSKLAGNLQRW